MEKTEESFDSVCFSDENKAEHNVISIFDNNHIISEVILFSANVDTEGLSVQNPIWIAEDFSTVPDLKEFEIYEEPFNCIFLKQWSL